MEKNNENQNNLLNCVCTKDMTPAEACEAMVALANMLPKEIGIGVWEGKVAGHLSGNEYNGMHIGLFDQSRLVALFGPHGDRESEAAAALLSIAVKNAHAIAELIKLQGDK